MKFKYGAMLCLQSQSLNITNDWHLMYRTQFTPISNLKKYQADIPTLQDYETILYCIFLWENKTFLTLQDFLKIEGRHKLCHRRLSTSLELLVNGMERHSVFMIFYFSSKRHRCRNIWNNDSLLGENCSSSSAGPEDKELKSKKRLTTVLLCIYVFNDFLI